MPPRLALIDPSKNGANSHLVLTPHAGELAAMLTRCGTPMTRREIEGSPLSAARAAAALLGAVVLLKGANNRGGESGR